MYAQLGQIALNEDSWKLVVNVLDRPGIEGKGIELETIDAALDRSYIWLTDTEGTYERNPVITRLGSNLDSGCFLVVGRPQMMTHSSSV